MLQQQYPYATSSQSANPELARSLEDTVSNLRALESCIDALRNDLSVVAQSTGNFEAVQALSASALRSPVQGQIPSAAFANQAGFAGIANPYEAQMSPFAQQAAFAPQSAYASQMSPAAFAPQTAFRASAWAPRIQTPNHLLAQQAAISPWAQQAAISPWAQAASAPWAQSNVPSFSHSLYANPLAQQRHQAVAPQTTVPFAAQQANIANRQTIPSAPAVPIGPF